MKRILINGGYIENNQYNYYIQDHLGNNHIVANPSGGVTQGNHYYPFGMNIVDDRIYLNSQPYKYSGKELDTSHGLNLYDFSARLYDGTVPRFTTVDPKAEKKPWLTPYHYCSNNPINRIDPDGMFDWQAFFKSIGNGYVAPAKNLAKMVSNPKETIKQLGNYTANTPPEQIEMDMMNSATYGLWGFMDDPGGAILNEAINDVNMLANDQQNGTNTYEQAKGEKIGGLLFDATLTATPILIGEAGAALTKGVSITGNVSSSTGRGVKATDTLLKSSEILRIENAATRIGKPINVVGSRANGTANAFSDWDYVIQGLNSKSWSKIKNSLPGAKSTLDNTQRNIDLFKGPLDKGKPYITIHPKTK